MPTAHVCRVPATGSKIFHKLSRRLLRAVVAGAVASCAPAAANGLAPWSDPRPSAFALPTIDRSVASLSDAGDSVVVVHFFATWCEPCRAELVALDAYVRTRTDSRIRFFVISVGEPEARVRRFFANLLVSFPVLLDADGATGRAWGVAIFPTTFVLAPGLVPALKVEGELDWTATATHDALESLASKPVTR